MSKDVHCLGLVWGWFELRPLPINVSQKQLSVRRHINFKFPYFSFSRKSDAYFHIRLMLHIGNLTNLKFGADLYEKIINQNNGC